MNKLGGIIRNGLNIFPLHLTPIPLQSHCMNVLQRVVIIEIPMILHKTAFAYFDHFNLYSFK